MLKAKLDELYEIIKIEKAYHYAISIIHWDMETEMPKNGVENASNVIEFLMSEMLEKTINEKVHSLLVYLETNEDKLNFIDKATVKEMKKNYDKMSKVPRDIISKYESTKINAQQKWLEAKEKADFKIFLPSLKEIISFNKKIIEYRGFEEHPYNTLLNDYEINMNVEKLDIYFSYLEENLLPFIRKILKNKENKENPLDKLEISIEKQKLFSNFISRYINFDYEKGVLKESVHPFTLNLSNRDVRITTNYQINNVLSSIFSTLHECGHGLYEQNINSELERTPLNSGISMGIHESQSRLFENIFGRSYSFWKGVYPRLQEIIPEFENICIEEFYKGINQVKASFIRVEADELTYSLHIMLRYEIEKMIFNDEIDLNDLEKIWNEKTKEYFGLEINNPNDGILQDIHWSSGLFGYFPSYALGNAYASQIETSMREKMDLEFLLLSGNFKNINNYLKDNIHIHGKLYSPDELIKKISGEELNPKYYVEYLKNKYSNI